MERQTFIDDKSFTNLEIGAGCGNFGKIFHSKCYLTDCDLELKKICDECHIDWFCDAHDLTWKNDRFDTVIMCNPYRYGFNTIDDTERLMWELLRVLKRNKSKIIMVCRHDNKYCNPYKVNKMINTFLEKYESFYSEPYATLSLTVESTPIDSKIDYEGYVFKRMDGGQTFPNYKITIHVEQYIKYELN